MSIVCDTGFINIVDPFLNPDSTVWTGSITYTLQYATTVAGATLVEARQVINVSDGIDICLAPGLYTVVYNQSGQRLPVTSQWTVPPTGGPYTIADLEGVGPVTGSLTVTGPFIAMSTVTMTSLINAAARPYVATDSVGLLSTGNLALIAISGSASDLASGTVAAARGGAGTLSGLLKANGAGVVSAAVAGTDYAVATNGTNGQALTSNGTGGFGTALTLATVATSGSASDLTAGTLAAARGGAGTLTGILKANGAGVVSAATAGTDYAVATNGTNGQALTSNGTGGFSTALTLATVATSGSATDLSSGTLPAARMPALTGDVTSTVGTVAATVVKINGTTLSGLATGLLKNTTATGVPSIAVAGTDLIGGVGNLTTVGAVPYVSASGILNQDPADFFWDATNNRLGIGTATPATTLQVGTAVGSPATNANAVIINAANTTLSSRGSNLQVITTNSSAIDFGGSIGLGGQYNTLANSVEFASIAGRKENSAPANFAGYLQFVTTADGVAPTEKMRITSAGNVGIGTTSPSANLQIGAAVAYNRTSPAIAVPVASAAVKELLEFGSDTRGGGLTGYQDGSGLVRVSLGTRTSTNIISEQLSVLNSGAVGIGTTTPVYAFDVAKSSGSGTARFYDQTATTGATRVVISLGAADTSSTQVFEIGGLMKFSGSNSTGAGTALLSTNSPAVTNTAPYTWFKVLTSDGSTGYIPVWK